MKIIFLGTPRFAVPSLDALLTSGHEVAAVYTQPDRPKGRHGDLAASAVKQAALSHGLTVLQPERIRRPENADRLRQDRPDLMVVVGYGQIIPQAIIDIPPHGILNVHASLLPKYRGAAPIQWALARGETETGVTIMRIDAGLDTGDMLFQVSCPIAPDEAAPELSARLAALGAAALADTVRALAAGRAAAEKQNHAEATLAPILKKEDGLADWTLPAHAIYNRWRGFQPWPGLYTTLRGQPLQIWRAQPAPAVTDLGPGGIRIRSRHLFAGCGGGSALELLELQLAGKKRMPVEPFLNGYHLTENDTLGDLS